MGHSHCATTIREPWNKGKLVGQKAPFKLKEIECKKPIGSQPANPIRDSGTRRSKRPNVRV